MSPEQVRGEEADARSDIWATGVVLYEMLTARVPFKGGYPEAIAHAIRNETPEPLRANRPDVPEALEQLVFRAVHKDVNIRFQSARDLVRALRRIQGRTLPLDLRTEPIPLKLEAGSSPAIRRPWWRTRAAVVTAATAVCLALAVIATPLRDVLLPPSRNQPAIPETKNVAVFPFVVVDGTPQDQAWATGLSVMLSASLTRLTGSSLQVAPLDQVQPGQLNAGTARRDLGATLILTGSIQRAGTMVSVSSQLRDTATSQELRNSTFSVADSDPTALQNGLLDAALDMLEIEVVDSERDGLIAHETTVPAAQRLYLQGRGYLQSYEKWDSIESAIVAFTEALKADSRYARAYAGLGEAYWRKTRAGIGQSAADARYDSAKDPEWSENAVANCTARSSSTRGWPPLTCAWAESITVAGDTKRQPSNSSEPSIPIRPS